MAFEDDVLDVPFKCTTDMSAYQYHFVKLSADGTVAICSHATNDNPIGVLQNKPDGSVTEAVARVRIFGVSRVYIGTATFAFGDKVGTDASGHGIAKDTDTYKFLGEAIMGGASTYMGTVLLHPLHTISKT